MATQTERPANDLDNIRQQKLALLISENRGRPLGEMMIEAGYSEEYAKNPQQLKKTKTWQQLMDQYLPDKLLARKHKELLTAKRQVVVKIIDKDGKVQEEIKELPDNAAVSKGLDLAYKIKGRMVEKHEIDSSEKLDKALDRLANLLP